MKKKISLFITALSLTASLSLQAAQAPLQPFGYEPQNIFHKIIGEELKISLAPEGASTQSLSIMSKPVSEDDEDMTIKMLIKAAHRSSRPFCFTLCRNADGKSAFALADDNLRPLADLPEGFIPLGKYKLYTGGKGQCFPPDFIIQQARPTVHIQQVPAPYPAPFPVFVDRAYPVPIPVEVKVPYLVDRLIAVDRPVAIPYFKTLPGSEKITHLSVPPLTPQIQSSQPIPECNKPTQFLQATLLTMQQKPEASSEAIKLEEDKKEAELIALPAQKTAEFKKNQKPTIEVPKTSEEDTQLKKNQKKARRIIEQQQKAEQDAIEQKELAQQASAKIIADQQEKTEQAQKDREAAALKKTKKEEAIKQQTEAIKQQEIAQQASTKKAATLTTPTPSVSGKKKGKATKDNDDDAFLNKAMAENAAITKAALIRKALAEKTKAQALIKNEETKEFFRPISPARQKNLIPEDIIPLTKNIGEAFTESFVEFFSNVKTAYQKSHSVVETKAMIEGFFKEKIINSYQMHFIFEVLRDKAELAVFYETLNRLISAKQLPLFPEEEFKSLSPRVATSLVAQIYELENNTRSDAKAVCTYLKGIQLIAMKNSDFHSSARVQK